MRAPDYGRVLFWKSWGPRVSYHARLRALTIEDLNPELRTHWVLSRWEVFLFGLSLMWGALR